ncbi:hypothetical protein TNCT_614041 [Trichonephila clavata]|uniref:Uncharacterized protein n=1 Tax=Trichonephila clavata TaxID=2740835 RepID=A0A8X6KS77_TRICU|nr:hypothetical protein TNCT_614041 [Trichonephila clavata]
MSLLAIYYRRTRYLSPHVFFFQADLEKSKLALLSIKKAQLEELENEKRKRKSGSADNIKSFDYMSEED